MAQQVSDPSKVASILTQKGVFGSQLFFIFVPRLLNATLPIYHVPAAERVKDTHRHTHTKKKFVVPVRVEIWRRSERGPKKKKNT